MSDAEGFIHRVEAPDGSIDVELLCRALQVGHDDLAVAAGLPLDMTAGGASSPPAQARLREVAEIIARVLPWEGGAAQAFAWYRWQPLPSFGRTAADLVRDGRGDAIWAHLARLDDGGHA